MGRFRWSSLHTLSSGLPGGSKNPCAVWNLTSFGPADNRRDTFSGTKRVSEVCVSEAR